MKGIGLIPEHLIFNKREFIMLQDIKQNIDLIEDSIKWAKNYGKNSFPYDVFKDYRRKLKRIYAALEENCSVAAYGESQVGKSYLMSSLLSSPDSPFVISNAGKTYSFIDEINPSGGNNSKIESTGVVTRFTSRTGNVKMRDYVKVRNLSVVDIILLLADSYYNDIKINQDSVLRYDEINKSLEEMNCLWKSTEAAQNYVGEDDIKDISEYIHDVIGSAASAVNQSDFCKIVAPVIRYVSYDKWVDIFSLLWNKNTELSHLFSLLINEYKKLDFKTDVYIPFTAVLREKGTLLKIDWLDTVCGVHIETGQDEIYTDVYDSNGKVLAHNFHKGFLSALVAELSFELPSSLVEGRRFLSKLDLLDFPGARSREKIKENELQSVLPTILRRGKVAYLFNKYSRSLRISSVLFCHHNDQKAEATIGEAINNWIEKNIGASPLERAQMLNNTNGIAPLFFVATKFNLDLERAKTDTPSNIDKLDAHWKRFNNVLPEIVRPNTWLDDWVTIGGVYRTTAFQNIYPLRDFYWSGKNGIFDGYSDGAVKSKEKSIHVYSDYPDYFANLKESFLNNDFVKRHFENPEQTWNDVATVNNDGSKAIIRKLDAIAGVLEDARKKKYFEQLVAIKSEILKTLSVYYEPEDSEAKNLKVKEIAGDIRSSLILSVGKDPTIFGRIIDNLMVTVGDLRNIAYNIIILHRHTPQEFSAIDFIRHLAEISPSDSREKNIEKLRKCFDCDDVKLEEILKDKGFTIEEVLSNETETLTTVADVVTKHILDYWNDYINGKAKVLEPILPHSDEVVFMLSSLLKSVCMRRILSERISRYCNMFNLNEQPNAIADYAALTLNNFVSSVGRNYMSDGDIDSIKEKAEKCHINVDLTPDTWDLTRKPQPLKQSLQALDEASNISMISKNTLMRLPFWNNFQRWENLVTIGLLYASDISHVDPIANAKVKELMERCDTLYNF